MTTSAGAPVQQAHGRLGPSRCSVQALVRGDRLEGTAVPQARWLLIEQPGPWGRGGLTQSRFDQSAVPALAARADTEGVRLMLVRRTGRHPERHPDPRDGLRWGMADTRPGRRSVRWAVRRTDAEIADAPWDDSLGEPTSRPVFLVCAHAAHDTCCAVKGRPLAASLPVQHHTDVWECSHTGGDRFAANMVVLPQGDVYGQVPGDGSEVLAAVERGQVALPWHRGRIGLHPAAQVAQARAREQLGVLSDDSLAVLAVDEQARNTWTVRLAGPDGVIEADVRRHASETTARLTCHAARPGAWFVWELLDLRVCAF